MYILSFICWGNGLQCLQGCINYICSISILFIVLIVLGYFYCAFVNCHMLVYYVFTFYSHVFRQCECDCSVLVVHQCYKGGVHRLRDYSNLALWATNPSVLYPVWAEFSLQISCTVTLGDFIHGNKCVVPKVSGVCNSF